MPKPRMVDDAVVIENLEGTVEGFITKLRKLVNEKVPKDAENVRLDLTTGYSFGETFSAIEVGYQRPETQEERNIRRTDEKIREDHERAQYEKLKAKFGDDP